MHRPITAHNRAISPLTDPARSFAATALRWVAINTLACRRAQARIDANGIHF